jgi:outer membrane protein OmpA-like peptidoglycan-associated protein
MKQKRLSLIVAGLFVMALLFGCAGLEKAPKERIPGYLAYPTELVQADRDIDAARAAGKDRECPDEFNAAKAMIDRAYETYMTCRTADAIEMAKKSSEMTAALCPVKQAAVVQPRPEPVVEPRPIVLEDVNFDFDRSTLTSVATGKLQRDIRVLKTNPGIAVKIEGHTDAYGSDDYNMRLGDRRATAVKEYLVKEGGISESRMSTISYGKTRLLMPQEPTIGQHESAEAKANRRVHFEVIAK